MYNSHFQKDMALVVLNQNLFAKAKMSFRISIVPTKLYLFNFGIKFTVVFPMAFGKMIF